jgi:gamma-glutamylaminecyclotransferase
MPPDPNLCFVYGTLRRGHGNHAVMRQAGGAFLGNAVSVRKFPLAIKGLPYLLDLPGQGEPAEGEIYRVPEKGWELLDRLEGHPGFYRRRVESFVLRGPPVQAWVYFLALKHLVAELAEVPHD